MSVKPYNFHFEFIVEDQRTEQMSTWSAVERITFLRCLIYRLEKDRIETCPPLYFRQDWNERWRGKWSATVSTSVIGKRLEGLGFAERGLVAVPYVNIAGDEPAKIEIGAQQSD